MIKDLFIKEDSIVVPVTFDYKGGRSTTSVSTIIASVVVSIVYIVYLLFLFSSDSSMLKKLVIFLLTATAYTFGVRFILLKENKFRAQLATLNIGDDTVGSYWGIYSVSKSYPYICDYIDGKRGVFISLSKDVFVGKGEDVVSSHYSAVADAYGVASKLKIEMTSIDYMDTIGNDTRIRDLHSELSNCKNTKLKFHMSELYKSLVNNVDGEFASYDVYCVTTEDKNLDLKRVVRALVGEFLEGNYIAYKVLDSDAIRLLCVSITRNKNFSLVDACDKVLNVKNYSSFKPLFHYSSTDEVTSLCEVVLDELPKSIVTTPDSVDLDENINIF